MTPEPGQLVAGRYRLERKLGQGGMGVVWAARQEVTLQPVALKFLKDDDDDPQARKRFLREARAACAVKHPNVVQVHDVLLLEDGTPVIVMELLEGEALAVRIKREKRLSVEDASRILLQVVGAVGTAHAHGVVHRDLKPDNIFLAKDASGVETVKVVDFGIAKLTSATDGDAEKTNGLTTTGTMLGTPYYMSPEQAFGEKDVDHRSDIWSLGIIFHRCFTGSLPTYAENVGQVLKIILSDKIPLLSEKNPDVPEEIVLLAKRMLARDRDARPKDLREVQNVLRRWSNVPVGSFGAPVAPPKSSGMLPDAPSSDPILAPPPPEPTRGETVPMAGGPTHAAETIEERATTSIGSVGFDLAVSDPVKPARRWRTLGAVLGVAAGVALVGGWASLRQRHAAASRASAIPTETVQAPLASVPLPAKVEPSPPVAVAPAPLPSGEPAKPKQVVATRAHVAKPAPAAPPATQAPAPVPKPSVFVEAPPF